MKTSWWAILLVISCTLLTSVAQVLWKFGAMKLPDIITNWQIWIGFIAYALAAGLLITSFKGGEVSVLFPLIATSYIWVTLLSMYFFDEIISLIKIVGIAFVIAGIISVGTGSKQGSAVDYVEVP